MIVREHTVAGAAQAAADEPALPRERVAFGNPARQDAAKSLSSLWRFLISALCAIEPSKRQMMRGNITRRGKSSWRLKYEAGEPDASGRRQTRYVTVRGTKKEAQIELIRLLDEIRAGTSVQPNKLTLVEYLREWLGTDISLAPKTLERYCQLAEQQIIPHLGATVLQKLRPAQINDWHGLLLKRGGKDGRPLAARTVGHAHRVLRRGLERALRLEIVSRNVAAAFRPPKVEAAEVVILSPDEMADVLAKLEGHTLPDRVALAWYRYEARRDMWPGMARYRAGQGYCARRAVDGGNGRGLAFQATQEPRRAPYGQLAGERGRSAARSLAPTDADALVVGAG